MNQLVSVPELSNREFLERYAKPGCIGLSGGDGLSNRLIRRAQRHICDDQWSNWSHAFIFGERRSDGHIWIIESDMEARGKHIRLGVQENRLTKYFNDEYYANLAVLDLHLSEEKVSALIQTSLDFVADATRYSVRELFGTILALRHKSLREKENLLAREKSMYCSAFVQHVFCKIGVELCSGVSMKNSTPEDVFKTAIPHTTYILDRQLRGSRLKEIKTRLRQRFKKTPPNSDTK